MMMAFIKNLLCALHKSLFLLIMIVPRPPRTHTYPHTPSKIPITDEETGLRKAEQLFQDCVVRKYVNDKAQVSVSP